MDRLCIIVIFLLFSLGQCVRISNKTYVEITGKAACIRRLNGTHQVGCNSKMKGNVGVLHYVTTDSELDWMINSGPHEPYAVMLNSENFNQSTVQRLRNSGKINGILVIHTPENDTLTPLPQQGFSPDDTCPGDLYGLYNNDKDYGNCKKNIWNPWGNGMFYEDFEFPIFIVTNKTEIEYLIKDCYEKFNKPTGGSPREYPLCAVQLKDAMSGAKDSETCIRRTNTATNLNPDTYCDPLGDKNVVALLRGVGSDEELDQKSVIIAAARMDSFSMFENIYPSADNHVSGIVGLLAAAEALGSVKDHFTNETKNILFTFLNGEAFDYIGSSRMIYDMHGKSFPVAKEKGNITLHNINLEHIDRIVEVSQLAYRDEGKLWIHSDPLSRNDTTVASEIDKMIEAIENISKGIVKEVTGLPLPPSSTQKFLQEQNIPAVVITDYKTTFTNKYYNSRFDLARAIRSNDGSEPYDFVTEETKNLTEAATLLARSLYKMATGNDFAPQINASSASVAHMLYCFLIDRRCELFREVIDPVDESELLKSSQTYPFYVSVSTNENHVTLLVKRLLSRFIGEKVVNATSSTCKQPYGQKVYQYVWMQGAKIVNSTNREPVCMKSTATTTSAKSPAFDINDYQFWSVNKYSTWTESSWQTGAINLQVFLVPSKAMETTILSVGVILTLVSMVTIYFLNSKSDILFAHPRPRSC